MAKGFEVELTGQYVARSGVMGKERVLKDYKIKCIVPNSDKVLSVIKNKILGPKLKQAYDDYLLFRTYHILSITPLSDEDKFSADMSNIRYMGRSALIQLVKVNALNVPYELYPSLFKLREAVLFASNDPKGYAKHLSIHREDLELDVAVAACNPELQEEESETYHSGAAAPKSAAPDLVPTSRAKLTASHIEKQTENRLGGLTADMKKDGEMGDMDEETIYDHDSIDDI